MRKVFFIKLVNRAKQLLNNTQTNYTTGPISCKNVTGNCFSYKLRSEVQLISDSMIVGFELYVYDVKVNFELGTKFIYDV